MPIQAIWNNVVIAESDDYMILEGRFYFPPDSVQKEFLIKNGNEYISRWKGTADYYDIIVANVICRDGAWSYPKPEKEIGGVKDYFSFSDNVKLVKK
jgi:uncharacterized protein (DUF427 family)